MKARLVRPATGRLEVTIPYASGNRDWLKSVMGPGTRPEWSDGRWLLARNHYRALVTALAGRFGRVEVVNGGHASEVCNVACQEAIGDDCTCSCGGRYHGGGVLAGFTEVGEGVLVQRGADVWATHLVTNDGIVGVCARRFHFTTETVCCGEWVRWSLRHPAARSTTKETVA